MKRQMTIGTHHGKPALFLESDGTKYVFAQCGFYDDLVREEIEQDYQRVADLWNAAPDGIEVQGEEEVRA